MAMLTRRRFAQLSGLACGLGCCGLRLSCVPRMCFGFHD